MVLELALIGAAVVLGATHTLAPDHWMPFAAVARARGWNISRTLWITAISGVGHVSTSIILSALAIIAGIWVADVLKDFESIFAGSFLVMFGVVYTLLSLRGHTHPHTHTHLHEHGETEEHTHTMTDRYGYGLVALASVSPCVPFIPLMVAAVPYGAWTVAAATAAFVVSTISAMIVLVMVALSTTRKLSFLEKRERELNVAAGLLIALIGIGVLFFGI